MFDARPNLASPSALPNTGAAAAALPKGPPIHHHASSLSPSAPSSSHHHHHHHQQHQQQSSLLSHLRSHVNMECLRTFREQRLGNMRPWLGEFLNREQFNVPQGLGTVQTRLFSNLSYFHSNYLVVLGILFIYCTIRHLMLAFMIAGLFAGYIYCASLSEDYAKSIAGTTFTKRHIQAGLIIFGLLMLFFTNVGSAFFWLVGLSALVIGSHAIFHEVSLESDFGQRV